MTDSEKRKLKHMLKTQAFGDAMASSSQKLLMAGAEPGADVCPNSWEGMMAMVEDVMAHGSPEKKAGAVFAVACWVWGRKEHDLYEKVAEIIDGMEAEAPAEAPEPEPAKPAK